jgi:hypothetical protein
VAARHHRAALFTKVLVFVANGMFFIHARPWPIKFYTLFFIKKIQKSPVIDWAKITGET